MARDFILKTLVKCTFLKDNRVARSPLFQAGDGTGIKLPTCQGDRGWKAWRFEKGEHRADLNQGSVGGSHLPCSGCSWALAAPPAGAGRGGYMRLSE